MGTQHQKGNLSRVFIRQRPKAERALGAPAGLPDDGVWAGLWDD